MKRYPHDATRRLKRDDDFTRVAQSGLKQQRGPITFRVTPSTTAVSRLGIRAGRAVGSAPERNQIKRMLREAFRLMQHDWPMPLDVLAQVRKHELMSLAEYQKLMSGELSKAVRQMLQAKSNP
jgi:ribonuclease P protein component